MFLSNMLGDGPSLTVIWSGFIGLGLAGFCLSFLRWWAAASILVVICLWGLVLLADFYAPDLYPVYSIQFPEFLYSATIAIVAGTLLPLVGIMLNIVRRLHKTK
jgi:hypothetical protein